MNRPPSKLLRATITAAILCLATAGFARTFGTGPYVSYEFPPVRPANPPAFFVPEPGRNLDEPWEYVQTLLDAIPDVPTLFNAVPVGMAFTREGRGYLATLHTVFRTTDGGQSWHNLDPFPPGTGQLSTFAALRSPNYVSAMSARLIDRDGFRLDTVLVTTINSANDTGSVRLVYYLGGMILDPTAIFSASAWLTGITVPDTSLAYVFAGLDGHIYANDSLGIRTQWDLLNPAKILIHSTRQDTLHLSDTWVSGVTSAGHSMFAVGSHHWISRDDGAHWQIRPRADSLFDNCISFCDSFHGIIGGGMISPQSQGWVHMTTNSGATWTDRSLETDVPIRAVQMVTPEIAFAAGGDYNAGTGQVWKTSDGGATWTLELNVNAEIKTLGVTRTSTAYLDVFAVGVFPDFRAGVWRTRVYLPDTSQAVLIADPDTLDFGACRAHVGDTLVTTLRNLGSVADTVLNIGTAPHFAAISSGVPVPLAPGQQSLVSVVFLSDSSGDFRAVLPVNNLLSGRVTLICRASIPSAADNSRPLPEDAGLTVYPNPGNAAFEIRFELARAQAVRLSVYDLTGRLVENLAQGNLSAGAHTQLWNGAPFSSGIYFVRLESPGGAMTRKLLLLK
jgi:photosystem II stability/assembly factor-like uncharacterized protein